MSREFEAIYENGVLRPLQPVKLREREVVTVSVAQVAGESSSPAISAEELRRGEKQRSVLLAFTSAIAADADATSPDGLSNRDHDRLIYGE